MLLTPVEKFTFNFISRFYFYLWPFAVTWNKSFTAIDKPQHNLIQKGFYYLWVFAMLSYSTGGLLVASLYNKYTGKIIIEWMRASIIVATTVTLPFIWLIVHVAKTLIDGFNQIMLLLIKFNKGNIEFDIKCK